MELGGHCLAKRIGVCCRSVSQGGSVVGEGNESETEAGTENGWAKSHLELQLGGNALRHCSRLDPLLAHAQQII